MTIVHINFLLWKVVVWTSSIIFYPNMSREFRDKIRVQLLYFMQGKHRKPINLIPPLDLWNIYKYLKEKFEHFLLSIMTLNTADTTIPFPIMSHSESQPHYSVFRWLCISLHFFANDQIDALFYIFIYYTSLHVSNITVLIIRRSNCINTSFGMISLCEWLLGMPVRTGIPSSQIKKCVKLVISKELHYSTCGFSKSSHYKAVNTNSVAWEYEIVIYLRGYALSKLLLKPEL